MTATAPKEVVSLSLYAIGQQYEAIIEQVIENDGEITEALALELAAIEDRFEEKAEKVVLYIRNLLGTAAAAQSEAERLGELADSRTRAADALKRYLFENMQLLGKEKIDRPLAKLRIQANGGKPAVKWAGDPETVPAPYRTEKIVYGLDRDRVIADHEAGKSLPDGLTCERGKGLRIS